MQAGERTLDLRGAEDVRKAALRARATNLAMGVPSAVPSANPVRAPRQFTAPRTEALPLKTEAREPRPEQPASVVQPQPVYHTPHQPAAVPAQPYPHPAFADVLSLKPKRKINWSKTAKIASAVGVLALIVIVAPHAKPAVDGISGAAKAVTAAVIPGSKPADESKIPVGGAGAPAIGQLIIPSISLNVPVISVSLTSDGKMDAPKTLTQAGLYAGGPRPGQSGTAVIDGHFGVGDQAGVFRMLDHLKIGDIVTYKGNDGTAHDFKVTLAQAYPTNNDADAKLFATAGHPVLNLVTCAGNWNGSDYDQRFIVSADPIN